LLKAHQRRREKINAIIGTLHKHKSETENNINREINKLKTKKDNTKEEVTHDLENLR
jgi:hypothetical protein